MRFSGHRSIDATVIDRYTLNYQMVPTAKNPATKGRVYITHENCHCNRI